MLVRVEEDAVLLLVNLLLLGVVEQERGKIHPVEAAIAGEAHPREAAEGGEQVERGGEGRGDA